MPFTLILNILKLHSVRYKVLNGRILAWEKGSVIGQYLKKPVDLTDFTQEEILAWLGY